MHQTALHRSTVYNPYRLIPVAPYSASSMSLPSHESQNSGYGEVQNRRQFLGIDHGPRRMHFFHQSLKRATASCMIRNKDTFPNRHASPKALYTAGPGCFCHFLRLASPALEGPAPRAGFSLEDSASGRPGTA